MLLQISMHTNLRKLIPVSRSSSGGGDNIITSIVMAAVLQSIKVEFSSLICDGLELYLISH